MYSSTFCKPTCWSRNLSVFEKNIKNFEELLINLFFIPAYEKIQTRTGHYICSCLRCDFVYNKLFTILHKFYGNEQKQNKTKKTNKKKKKKMKIVNTEEKNKKLSYLLNHLI